ncbi:hypothetical protein EJ08DRAFT_272219 [Tothia fuscella]|uniref:F-box domain-containing protein n=1 Tax=Tothia fuscella TaxID=1048955 RepID=A0A9P4NQ99_9PEZI|nr:hypothetical protein EJ08DRAFT_272219 [Tothia fuscella]
MTDFNSNLGTLSVDAPSDATSEVGRNMTLNRSSTDNVMQRQNHPTLPHLPLEIMTAIVSQLCRAELSHDNDYQWRQHTKASRSDIFNVRMVCGGFYAAALPAFGRILEEVRWSMMPGSLQTLMKVCNNLELREHIHTLTSTRHALSEPKAAMKLIREIMQRYFEGHCYGRDPGAHDLAASCVAEAWGTCFREDERLTSDGENCVMLTAIFGHLSSLQNLRVDTTSMSECR